MVVSPPRLLEGGSSRAADLAARFGFRSGERGTHASRSIMLADLSQLLSSTPPGAAYQDYRLAIQEDNVLGKATASTRLWSWKKLRELYGLDPRLAVFRCFRQLWETDSAGRPLLALLCACARDPLLRTSAAVILEAPLGSAVRSGDFAKAMEQEVPDRFTPKTLQSMGRNLLASWTQSGHLTAGKIRKRARPLVSPEAAVYALFLGRLTGARGPLLFSTFWTALLDIPEETLHEFAARASRRSWIDLRRAGNVVEVGFPKLLLREEEEALREPD
ncbi:MAG TPA: hypothetical protein VLT87_04265 [Thermoanaerobaculia bacterium]|nr:hypothetical protein [Thermoanaerobaculia bacterium]